jgi:antitoxin component of RelBE/YafQ-DinJ toxin-antitoxin module
MDTTMLIKTNKALKQRAQKLAKEMGLPLGTLVNNYLRSFIIDRQAVFSASIPNKKTAAAIDAARKDIKAGKNISGPFSTAKEAIAYLKTL